MEIRGAPWRGREAPKDAEKIANLEIDRSRAGAISFPSLPPRPFSSGAVFL